MTTPPQKVSLYSVNDLKNATDDALPSILTTLPKPYTFKQTHTFTDIRLLTGFSAVIIAGSLFYYDHKFGWDFSKPYTLPACVVYFLLNGFLTYWIWMVEAGTVFVGVREGGQKLILKSSSTKHTPIYKLKITYSAPSGQKWQDKEVTGKFTEWFNSYGFLQKKEFREWLAKNVDVVGTAFEEEARKTKTGTTSTTTSSGTTTLDTTSAVYLSGTDINVAGQTATSSATQSVKGGNAVTKTPKTKRKT